MKDFVAQFSGTVLEGLNCTREGGGIRRLDFDIELADDFGVVHFLGGVLDEGPACCYPGGHAPEGAFVIRAGDTVAVWAVEDPNDRGHLFLKIKNLNRKCVGFSPLAPVWHLTTDGTD